MDENKGKKVTVVVRKKPSMKSSVVNQMVSVMRNEKYHGANSDVMGSYTGTCMGDDPVPEQDVDDL